MSEENTQDAPSIDDMIDASIGEPTDTRNTTLDDFRITLESSQQPESEAEPVPTVVIGGDEPKRRGRPKGSGTGVKKKAELARELESTKAELEALRARNDSDKLDNLAKQIEMASFLIFGVVAEKRGAHWGLKEDDAAMIGQTGSVALAPYAERFEKEAPWVMFALAVGKVIHVRVQEDKRLVAALPKVSE